MLARLVGIAALGLLPAGTALAGAVDRAGQSTAVLFEPAETWVEVSMSGLLPRVTGVATAASPTPGARSGDITGNQVFFSGAVKRELGHGFAAAFLWDQPFGASTAYPNGTGSFAAGVTAELDTNSFTGILKYTAPFGVSVFAGPRYQLMSGSSAVPVFGDYFVDAKTDGAWGYVAGLAYEYPELAFRVAATYNSRIRHNLTSIETGGVAPQVSKTELSTPQSVNVEFQTGLDPKTLFFGSVRWVNWEEFDYRPPNFLATAGISLVEYTGGYTTVKLGLGRQLDDNWSLAATGGFELGSGDFITGFGPIDGSKSLGLAAIYRHDVFRLTAGAEYFFLGDADVAVNAPVALGRFRDNRAVAFGLRLGLGF